MADRDLDYAGSAGGGMDNLVLSADKKNGAQTKPYIIALSVTIPVLVIVIIVLVVCFTTQGST